MTNKILVALDFDHTIIDENSDLFVLNLVPNKELPQDIKDKYRHDGWVEYMGEIFQFLHRHGITAKSVEDCMHQIPLTTGMMDLLQYVGDSEKYEVIIISDSNSVFIDFILTNFNLKQKITKVFTNPAEFSNSGCLMVNRYHTQDWCDLSTVNLCKGHILQQYIQERKDQGINFSKVMYIGDGSNDLCPGLTLRSQDYLCPRLGFSLLKKISKLQKGEEKSLSPQVLPWDTALDILSLLKNIDAK
ncbi:pyridoxal phosphate phosphatase PHOSPHO2-like isoform X2 [Gigantopelta aegis]|nr:pyridoxal phosphate phosphatase PHOSPHO2-like isoform X2 [Gigantopelta aegis]